MSLNIEFTKNGKPNILLNGHKYRESYTLKSGEIIWRCLGRSCGATIKSNSEKTTVAKVNSKHSGPHPVTMRALTSPQMSSSSPATPSATGTAVTRASATRSPAPAAEIVATRPSATRSPSHSGTPTGTLTSTVASCRPSPTLLARSPFEESSPNTTPRPGPLHCTCGLEAENMELKRRIEQLTAERDQILDHSIQSDARLLQFTDQLFVANSSLIETPGGRTTDCAVQCELPSSVVCQEPRCSETRDLVTSLKNTVEVLEAELGCFRAEAVEENHTLNNNTKDEGWVLVKSKPKRKSKKKKRNPNPEYKSSANHHAKNTPRIDPPFPSATSRRHHPPTNHPQDVEDARRKQFPFPLVYIEGDSHVRHLAGLVQQRVNPATRVSGTCRPGAGLLTVTSGDLPPPGSCCILFAGTNDVAADESDNILEHLERQLTARLSSSAVIVSTVPHRHDLPEDHPVNQRIDLVNFYIEELSIRHEGVELLNFNLIGRRWFTRHGMHLRLPGKRLLADLVLESLHRCARLFAARLPASPAAAAPACASHSSPPCLPAAALDSTSSTQPPFTAPGPHPVGAYSETAAQELTTNGICQKNYCLLTEVKVG
ncbi:hypothetical protein J6590_083533 [Homalodisca vitripennis]|nr:hypothetical protein J6590_083533 [Homalodisca vitripennis]